jgi:hypothetical protein
MAKNQGIVRLRGSIDGVTYSEGVNGRLSRSKSSLNKAKMDANPKYEVLRLIQHELGLFSKFGSLMRSGIQNELARVKPYRGVQRLNKILIQIKNEDTVHRMGERTVGEGLESEKGRALLKNFDFYGKTTVTALIDKELLLDPDTGVITIEKFNPVEDVIAPKNVTHLQLRSLVIGLDEGNGIAAVRRSEEVYLPLEVGSADVVLDPNGLPNVDRHLLFVVQLLFYKEVNGFRELSGTDSAALTIISVV